ncbi:MAG TPA: class I SAM-dependent methyltransferase [Pyrinomonadaceae bacterium]
MEGVSRPFYGEFAWAYDLLIAPPVASQCGVIGELFARRGVGAEALVLDAGCGTGRYAWELARRGYRVAGIDLSAALLAEARRRMVEGGVRVTLARGSVLALPFAPRLDAVLCRGVLNDLLDDGSRGEAFASFAGVLRRGGVLVCDVREWGETVRRKTREPVSEKVLETPRGRLTFRSETRLDEAGRRLLVSERHALAGDAGEVVAEYEFVMRCWTREELGRRLTEAGFGDVEYFGGYDLTPAGASDRLVCVSSRM